MIAAKLQRLPSCSSLFPARVAGAVTRRNCLLHSRVLRAMSSDEGTRWWNNDSVAVVTGANKGIGYEIARKLAKEGMQTVVTARSEELGRAAVEKIKQETGSSRVHFHRLDIADPASVDDFGTWLQSGLKNLTVLVNNAGLAYKGDVFGPDEAANTMATNFTGTRAVCERLLPLITSGTGRIVNVSSGAGKMRILRSADLKREFEAATTPDEIAKLADRFLEGVRNNTYADEGWPASMYGVSKLCLSQYSRVLAAQVADRGIAVNSCSPGYCATDMSSWRGTKTAEEGADTPVYLALLPPGGPTGGYYSERQKEEF